MLKITEEKNIAVISLDRPDVRNAFHPEMIQRLTDEFQILSQRNDLRAIVLSGEGKAFCAGADLNWMKSMVQYSLEQNRADSEKLYEMFESLWNCPIPIIGVVHGAAFGGALGLIAACDYVIAAENTQMCFSEVKIGLVPAVISAFILKKCSVGSIAPLMMSGQIFSPKKALDAGLVHEVVSESHLAESLARTVQNFQEAGPEAVRETKKLIRQFSDLDSSQLKAETCRVISERRTSSEGQEGLKSFLEKRVANWKAVHGS
ncbi:MAG: enoyl-CoA hydratase-related protein [Pseudobdellovibrionaceae bacterium]